ncbi:hypothetical protein EPN83_03260 [Patescibacteria group bacterium]|nr:MAG: hypothetical protein EPN83_03260 [Patescibacteria group bacterium]
MVTHDDFKKIEIRVGEILSAERLEGSEKLLKLSVDLGEERPRQVIAGIAPFFLDPFVLVGKRCAFAANLEPRQILGEISEAMILAAASKQSLSLLEVGSAIPSGMLIR